MTVTEAGGCSATATATITEPAEDLGAAISSTPASGSQHNVTVAGSGGTSPYPQYYASRGAGWQASNVFSCTNNLVYMFKVQDSNGCVKSKVAKVPVTAPRPALDIDERMAEEFANRDITERDYEMLYQKAVLEGKIKVEDFELFPNPAQDYVQLVFAEGEIMNGNIEVLNAFGQIVQRIQSNVETNLQRIDISVLAPGSYCLRVQAADGFVRTKCFVKVR